MTNPLNSYIETAKLRLDWAWRRIEEFTVAADGFCDSGSFEIIQDVRRHGKRKVIVVYRFKSHREPPVELRFMVGDALHNLRAVVDNVFWAVGQTSGSRKQRQALIRVGVVFFDSPSRFNSYYSPKISHLPDAVQKWLEDIQPYKQVELHQPIRWANTLWNRDKHRSPMLIAGSAEKLILPPGTISPTGPRLDYVKTIQFGALTDGDAIAEARLAREDIERFQPIIPIDVVFEEPRSVAGKSVKSFLIEVHEYIRQEIIVKFNSLLN